MNVPERTNEQMNGQTNEWNGRNAGSHSPCSLVLQLDFIANKYIICRNVISSISFCCSVDMLAIHNGDNVNQAPFNILLVIWLFFVSFLGGAAIQLYSIFFTPNFKWSNLFQSLLWFHYEGAIFIRNRLNSRFFHIFIIFTRHIWYGQQLNIFAKRLAANFENSNTRKKYICSYLIDDK